MDWHENSYSNFYTSLDGYSELNLRKKSTFGSAVKELDAYICEEEKGFGEIIVHDNEITPRRSQPNISKSLSELKVALKKDKIEKEEAYEYLKKSNKTMKNIIKKLQDEMKICRENIRTEFINFENLNTERLLSINPRDFVTSTARRK